MSKVKAQHRDAALRELLADGDLMHCTPAELARWQSTDCGLVGVAAWTEALAVCAKYEPLRALYQRRELPRQINQPQASCLRSAGVDLWRLRHDLLHLPVYERVVVGTCRVQRVSCEYGTRWLIGDDRQPYNEFDALMALKEQYMTEMNEVEVSYEPRIAELIGWAVLRAGMLQPDALAVYAALLRFAADDRRDGEPPSNKELGAACGGISDKRVRAALEELVNGGLITVENREGRSPLYGFCGTLSTPPQNGRGHISYIYKSQDSLQEEEKEFATPAKNGGGGKVDQNPEQTAAVVGLLKAWKDASGTVGSPFANRTYRAQALELHKAGVTPDDVTRYVKSLVSDPFWKKNGVKWGKVASSVRAWAGKLAQPEAKPAQPAVDVPRTDYGGL